MIQNSGSCSAFACIQAANDWLDSGNWNHVPTDSKNALKNQSFHDDTFDIHDVDASGGKSVLVVKTLIQEINASGWVPRNINDVKIEHSEEEWGRIREKEAEVEEKREWEYVKAATDEACRRAASAMKMRNKNGLDSFSGNDIDINSSNGNNLDNRECDGDETLEEAKFSLKLEPSVRARGVWSYTVGLVGKPSAGAGQITPLYLLYSSLSFKFLHNYYRGSISELSLFI